MKLNVTGETMSSLVCCRESEISRGGFQLNLYERITVKMIESGNGSQGIIVITDAEKND